MSKQIKNVEFLTLEISFHCIIPYGCVNLGLLTLEYEGRQFQLDTVTSRWYTPDEAFTTIEIDLKVDEDVSVDCKFDLTEMDLYSNNLKATLWLEEAIEISNGEYVEPDYISLGVKFLNPDGTGMTKSIDVEIDS